MIQVGALLCVDHRYRLLHPTDRYIRVVKDAAGRIEVLTGMLEPSASEVIDLGSLLCQGKDTFT